MWNDFRVLPYTAYLRVYLPLDAFSSTDRAYWAHYADSPHRPRRVHTMAAEHAESLRRLVATPPVAAPHEESRHAYVRRSGSELFICPWQTRLRSWLAFRDFHRATSARLRSAYLPDHVAASVDADFRGWCEQGGSPHPQTLSSNWRIPLAWFAPFAERERCLVLRSGRPHRPGSPPASAGDPDRVPDDVRTARPPGGVHYELDEPSPAATRVLLYVTDAAGARRRLEHAAAAMRRGTDEVSLLPGLTRLEDWLATVAHPRALLELDYGGLVRLFGDDELGTDHSAAELAAAIRAVESGQDEVVLAMLRRLRHRWRSAQALERAN
ncbi:hypothetical protein CLV63_103304 [Murinocardiopsis flavida]|uniref:DUF8083 domain-containing protein n=1 Tax=Murinocardiopsis flavida TaxID=645275 RepID=A0A2P8DQT4_9ACTN|nr:hypothetical protein [Murinocardiopsis flavida]PSK99579.1 hypothetical protein CLV63_103304 [Murinocardiopsis flavida]